MNEATGSALNWRPKLLAIAPYCDLTDVGESWCAAKWISEVSKRADVTLITMERPNRKPLSEQLPGITIISRSEPAWCLRYERLNSMAKLSYPGFYVWAKRQIRKLLKCGEQFDVAQQFGPLALRFPTPLTGFGIPYVLGPQGGSLDTPSTFESECQSAHWYTKFRTLDKWRLRYDPMLKRSYAGASLVLGVAPYVEDLLSNINIKRFEVESELGISKLGLKPVSEEQAGKPLKLLHVGRGVRTKGLRDVIRALSMVQDLNIHLDVAGKGEEMPICQQLARELNISDRITFHGQISRDAVDTLYRQADIFCFPSFREPSGSVIYEAMSFGLPVIAADRGGPGHVITNNCGCKITVSDPGRFARDIAVTIRALHAMPDMRKQLGKGAAKRMQSIALWPKKIERLIELYEEICVEHDFRKEPNQPCLTPNKAHVS